MRRLKSQVAKELPPKVEKIQYTEMVQEQMDYYEEIRSGYRNKILDNINAHGLGSSQYLLLQGLTQLRQIANHPKMVDENYQGNSGKLDDVISMVNDIIVEDHKVLIFSQFVKHLAIVKCALTTNNVDFSYLDGSTKNRAQAVEEFQNDNAKKIFLISLKAGGLGLNLTQADYVFILDPWWNPAVEAQAIDRAHRIGQKNKVFTYKFISKNSVEEKILSLQQKKLKLATDLISMEEGFVKKLTTEDIENILS